MPARELLGLLFKDGKHFHNQEAISIAMHRGLIDDIYHEAAAYARLEKREPGQDN